MAGAQAVHCLGRRGRQICDDIIKLLNAVNTYNSGSQVQAAEDQLAVKTAPHCTPSFLASSYNSNAFTFTLLQEIGLNLGKPTGFAPGWGQYVPGL